MQDDTFDPSHSRRPPSPKLLAFQLRGLHGYKDLAIECADPASIVLAENGVGKTTLLNTLYALLSGRISRLASLDFESATLTFDSHQLEFRREDAFKATDANDARSLLSRRPARELMEYGLNPEQLFDLVRIYSEGNRDLARRHPNFSRIYQTSPWDYEDIFMRLERLRSVLYDSAYISEFRNEVARIMGDATVLYLPTYRRIEATFDELAMTRSRKSKITHAEEEPETDQLIYFGLSDVEEKLERITRFIQQSMLEAYSRLSGNVLDALLGMRQFELPLDQPIDLEPVRLMLGRLGKSNSFTESELQRALTGSALTSEKYGPLTYFLRQLLGSYEASRPQELSLEAFVNVVNGYLDSASTDKRLRFDKVKLKVEVWHEALRKSLPLGSLSSGEKQVLSIFSRLILDPDKRYLILIDEPELSLSIEWQRKFLPDVLRTNSCEQLIAITHSPFVFENELDIYARSISVNSRPVA